MKTLIVGFSIPIKATLFSRLIQWAEGGITYDHVYIKWNWSIIDRDIIYQASKMSVNFESNITFDGHAKTIESYEINVDDQTHKEIMQFCMDNSGKPYGIKQIIGFGWIKLCGLFGKKVNNPFPSYGATFVCSKIIAAILQKADIKVDDNLDNVDPLLLNEVVKKAGLKRLS